MAKNLLSHHSENSDPWHVHLNISTSIYSTQCGIALFLYISIVLVATDICDNYVKTFHLRNNYYLKTNHTTWKLNIFLYLFNDHTSTPPEQSKCCDTYLDLYGIYKNRLCKYEIAYFHNGTLTALFLEPNMFPWKRSGVPHYCTSNSSFSRLCVVLHAWYIHPGHTLISTHYGILWDGISMCKITILRII